MLLAHFVAHFIVGRIFVFVILFDEQHEKVNQRIGFVKKKGGKKFAFIFNFMVAQTKYKHPFFPVD